MVSKISEMGTFDKLTNDFEAAFDCEESDDNMVHNHVGYTWKCYCVIMYICVKLCITIPRQRPCL